MLSIKPAMPLSIDGTNGQMTVCYIDSAGLMAIEARGNYLLTRDKDLSQPATQVDTA